MLYSLIIISICSYLLRYFYKEYKYDNEMAHYTGVIKPIEMTPKEYEQAAQMDLNMCWICAAGILVSGVHFLNHVYQWVIA